MAARAVAWMMLAVLAAMAQTGGSVAEIVQTVRASVAAGRSDGSLAKTLRKIKPAERLDDRVIDELESAGAGPKAVAELERLRDASQRLPEANPPIQFPHPPAPTLEEQRRILAAARATALNYTRSLPDFICTEIVRRYENLFRGWELKDTLEMKLSYFDEKEEYKLLTVNGRPARQDYREIGGAVTEGEFGSTLLSVFHPDSATSFRWDHWTTLRKRPAHVFAYRIGVEHSIYRMEFRATMGGPEYSTIAGQHGLVYVDAENGQVVRIAAEADTIPPDFPVHSSSSSLDYGFAVVGGKQFLLPLRAGAHMETDRVQIRNVVEFRDYRKFTGESTITFH